MLQPHLYYAEQVDPDDRGTPLPARVPVPCLITAVFEDGYSGEVEGSASAWSATAVWCVFFHPDIKARPHTGLYRVWVPPRRVQRLTPPG